MEVGRYTRNEVGCEYKTLALIPIVTKSNRFDEPNIKFRLFTSIRGLRCRVILKEYIACSIKFDVRAFRRNFNEPG